MHDTYASGPFSRVYFALNEFHELATFTNTAAAHRVQDKGTLVKTIVSHETPLTETRWLPGSGHTAF